jgi:hypothetical protein
MNQAGLAAGLASNLERPDIREDKLQGPAQI